jgi:uncharacterized membrane protein
MERITKIGRFFVVISIAIFGLDHLLAARFVAGLVPRTTPVSIGSPQSYAEIWR